jgi:hypothetical protein
MIVSQATALARKLSLDAEPGELVTVLKATAFKGQVSDAQMAALLAVAKHIRISESGCWEWVGARNPKGYGQLTYKGKHQTAHRFAFAGLVEPIEDGKWVLHHCDNARCVKPAHLYQGTPTENRADAINRNRWSHPWGLRSTCANGHDYETVGYRIDKSDGSRVCRECQRNYKREQRATKKGIK